MKITRKTLLIIIAALGIFLIGYSLIRQLTGYGFNEKTEKQMMDVIIIAALGLFVYNRKMAKDEKRAKETAEEAERRRMEGEEPEEEIPEDDDPEDESLPHWERNKKAPEDDEEYDDEGEDER
jgi:hypothetical protein